MWRVDAAVWLTLISGLGSALAAVLILRTFPSIVGAALVKSIEADYEEKLEKLRSALDAKYATLGTAVAYLSESQTQLREKRIEAAEALWSAVLEVESKAVYAVEVHRYITEQDLAEYFESGRPAAMGEWLDRYRNAPVLEEMVESFRPTPYEKYRVFSAEKLWIRFSSLLRAHERVIVLLRMSFRNGSYADWRADSVMEGILRQVMDETSLREAKERSVGGLVEALYHLRMGCLREAVRIMPGSGRMAEDLAAIQDELLAHQRRVEDGLEDGGKEERVRRFMEFLEVHGQESARAPDTG